jgi:hypothetical protein
MTDEELTRILAVLTAAGVQRAEFSDEGQLRRVVFSPSIPAAEEEQPVPSPKLSTARQAAAILNGKIDPKGNHGLVG